MNSDNDPMECERVDLGVDLQHAIDKAWAIEINRRTEKLKKGAIQSIPWSEVKKQARGRSSFQLFKSHRENHA